MVKHNVHGKRKRSELSQEIRIKIIIVNSARPYKEKFCIFDQGLNLKKKCDKK